MTFLQSIMLAGIAAIAIPIIIHLLNRSKPRRIDWGAMQFLLASMNARSRRVKIEDGILLCLRCLALATLAIAMARPFLPSASAIPWLIILPGILLSVLSAGIATVLWTNVPLRRRSLKLAAILSIIAILAALLEQRIQARRWMTAAGGVDTVIIIDASMSMTLVTDGVSHFDQALQETRALVQAARPGDAIALVLGAPLPRPLVSRPTSDKRELLRVLQSPECKPAGGIMATLETLNLASSLLADGPNLSKTIVIFTDTQAAGWEPRAERRWTFLADGFKSFPAPPRIICRRFPSPATFRNTLVSEIRLARSTLGTDRPVTMEVSVVNSGNVPAHPGMLELCVDGERVERTSINKDLLPQTTEAFLFNHQFASPGYHVIRATLGNDDDLPADDSLEQVVHVLERLPVLLVEGASNERFFFGKTASLIRVAMTPRDNPDTTQTGNNALPELPFLIKPTVVEAADLATIHDLSLYRVIVLADVPRLPAAEAERISAFVKAGGGLLITPGFRAEPAFYNTWQTSAGEDVLPARLEERVYPQNPLTLDLLSFKHPALHLAARPAQSDLRLGLVAGYWKTGSGPTSTTTRVGGRLESGDPWLLEHHLGQGNILMIPMAFDRRDSNLPSLKSFVPLVHETVYFLAAPSLQVCHVAPGTEWTLSAPVPADPPALSSPRSATVVTPSGEVLQSRIEMNGGRFAIRFTDTRQPGLHHVRLPAAFAASAGALTNSTPDVLFSVDTQPGESNLTPLTDADLAALRSHIDLFLPKTADELLTALSGKVPGQELWKILVLCALFTLIAETALTRWITLHRHLHQATPVTLASPVQGVQTLRTRLTELITK